jgi:TPR repeat protein
MAFYEHKTKFGAAARRKQAAAVVRQARKGDAAAQFRVAEMYFGGDLPDEPPTTNFNFIVVEACAKTAFKFYMKAAAQGHADAQGMVGFCYEHAAGVAHNLTQAIAWYAKAAAQGDELSIEVLAYHNHILNPQEQ